jgi:hypothetical protein
VGAGDMEVVLGIGLLFPGGDMRNGFLHVSLLGSNSGGGI